MSEKLRAPVVHICGGEPWELKDINCPFCDDKMPGIFRLVFDGYESDAVCGFCGTWISSGEYNSRMSQSERRRNIALVERERQRRRDSDARHLRGGHRA